MASAILARATVGRPIVVPFLVGSIDFVYLYTVAVLNPRIAAISVGLRPPLKRVFIFATF